MPTSPWLMTALTDVADTSRTITGTINTDKLGKEESASCSLSVHWSAAVAALNWCKINQ